jgi:hypothetical protein
MNVQPRSVKGSSFFAVDVNSYLVHSSPKATSFGFSAIAGGFSPPHEDFDLWKPDLISIPAVIGVITKLTTTVILLVTTSALWMKLLVTFFKIFLKTLFAFMKVMIMMGAHLIVLLVQASVYSGKFIAGAVKAMVSAGAALAKLGAIAAKTTFKLYVHLHFLPMIAAAKVGAGALGHFRRFDIDPPDFDFDFKFPSVKAPKVDSPFDLWTIMSVLGIAGGALFMVGKGAAAGVSAITAGTGKRTPRAEMKVKTASFLDISPAMPSRMAAVPVRRAVGEASFTRGPRMHTKYSSFFDTPRSCGRSLQAAATTPQVGVEWCSSSMRGSAKNSAHRITIAEASSVGHGRFAAR